MYNVCTLARFLTIHHCVFRPITRQQIFTFNAPLRTELSAKIRAPNVKAQIRLTIWRRCGAEGLSKGSHLFWHCLSLSGNFVFHLRWFFENRLLAAQIAQIPHCATEREFPVGRWVRPRGVFCVLRFVTPFVGDVQPVAYSLCRLKCCDASHLAAGLQITVNDSKSVAGRFPPFPVTYEIGGVLTKSNTWIADVTATSGNSWSVSSYLASVGSVMSVCPQASARLPLDGFAWSLV